MIKINYDDYRGEREYDDLEQAIYENLCEHKIDFFKVIKCYTRTLEIEKYKHEEQLSEIDLPLMNVIDPMKHLEGRPTKDAIYRYLVKYERFKGAPIWEDLVKYVKENNINLEGKYFNDLYY